MMVSPLMMNEVSVVVVESLVFLEAMMSSSLMCCCELLLVLLDFIMAMLLSFAIFLK